MIILKSLKLRNFLSHEETNIEFTDNQKLLIDGNSGSGKSAILEAIIWALYGEGRTSNTSLVRRGAKKASVELCLSDGIKTYCVERTITGAKHTLAIQIDGVAHPFTGVRELQAWIETELTGASYLLFVNSIAYVQGGPDSFVTQNATKRKDLLLEIVKTIDFDAYYEQTKSKITKEEKEIAGHEQSVAVRQEWLLHAEETIQNKEAVGEAISKCEINEDLMNKSRETSLIALGKVDEQVKTIARIDNELNVLRTDIINTDRTISGLVAEKTFLTSNITEPLRGKDIVEAEMLGVTSTIAALNKSISEAATANAARLTLLQTKPQDLHWNTKAEDVNRLLSDPSNHNKCSAADCPYYHEKTSKVAEYAALYAEYIQKQAAYEAELALWQQSYDVLPVIDVTPLQSTLQIQQQALVVLEREFGVLHKREGDINRIAQITEKLAELQIKLTEATSKEAVVAHEVATLKSSLDEAAMAQHTLNVKTCDTTLFGLRQEKALKQQQLGSILDTEARIPEARQALNDSLSVITTTKQNIHRLNLLKDAFGSKGLKAIVIDYILPELEEKINTILAQMSEFRVVLDTQQEKADGEGNKEGLFITIINDMGEEMPLENYSGGEKLKIIVSITEALATLQKCGFRLYDETWVGLDANSLESFSKVLDNLLAQFPQVICVSHLEEIKAAFENKVFVNKHNGISIVN